jgi:hypothetical protein
MFVTCATAAVPASASAAAATIVVAAVAATTTAAAAFPSAHLSPRPLFACGCPCYPVALVWPSLMLAWRHLCSVLVPAIWSCSFDFCSCSFVLICAHLASLVVIRGRLCLFSLSFVPVSNIWLVHAW